MLAELAKDKSMDAFRCVNLLDIGYYQLEKIMYPTWLYKTHGLEFMASWNLKSLFFFEAYLLTKSYNQAKIYIFSRMDSR